MVPGWTVQGAAAADDPEVRAVVDAAAAPGDAEVAHDEAAADVAATGPVADADAGVGEMAQLEVGTIGVGY